MRWWDETQRRRGGGEVPWSRHGLAMQPAGGATMLGDFGGARSSYTTGVTSTFCRRDGRYWVRTDGPEGSLAEYPVAYTFGVHHLQQYVVVSPKGCLQALSVVWDTHPKAEREPHVRRGPPGPD